jgi:hypothetical protein
MSTGLAAVGQATTRKNKNDRKTETLMTTKIKETYYSKEAQRLVGKKVVAVRPLSKQELKDAYWEEYQSDKAIAIIFDDGTVIIPLQDDEGNGPGVLEYGELSTKPI